MLKPIQTVKDHHSIASSSALCRAALGTVAAGPTNISGNLSATGTTTLEGPSALSGGPTFAMTCVHILAVLQRLRFAVWQHWLADDLHPLLPQHAHLLVLGPAWHHLHGVVPGGLRGVTWLSEGLVGDPQQSELTELCGRRDQLAVCLWWPCYAGVSLATSVMSS